MAAGEHVVGWDGRAADGRPVANGVYFLRLTTTEGSMSRRVVRLR